MPGLGPPAACAPGEAPQRSLQHVAGHPIPTCSSPGGGVGALQAQITSAGKAGLAKRCIPRAATE